MKKLSEAQQKVVDTINAQTQKFAGKAYEEIYTRELDRDDYTKRVFDMAQQGYYIVSARKATIDSLTKAGLIETYGEHDGQHQFVKLAGNEINNEEHEEETTMTVNEIKATFALEGKVYTQKTNGYCFVTENGKNRRIKAAEFEAAFAQYTATAEIERKMDELDSAAEDDNVTLEQFCDMVVDAQAELDKKPCRVEVDTDLRKPAVFRKDCPGCIDCSDCNVKSCVHRDCMRRNPRSEGGLGECPRLAVVLEPQNADPNDPENAYPDGDVEDAELKQIEEEIPGIEDAEAELERNIRMEKLDKAMKKLGYTRIDSEWDDIRYSTCDGQSKVMAWNTVEEGLEWVKEQNKGQAKKERKPRRSKDIAYEMVELDGEISKSVVTLTVKQVDFIRHLSDSCFWEEGLDSILWTDVLCDEIGGQFAGKPMTVGAMISTLCEKKLGVRGTDRRNGKKCTSFTLTELGKKVAAELGLK